jgi:hypothetical protein
MKSSKSNSKISVAAIFFVLRHPLTIYQLMFATHIFIENVYSFCDFYKSWAYGAYEMNIFSNWQITGC